MPVMEEESGNERPAALALGSLSKQLDEIAQEDPGLSPILLTFGRKDSSLFLQPLSAFYSSRRTGSFKFLPRIHRAPNTSFLQQDELSLGLHTGL